MRTKPTRWGVGGIIGIALAVVTGACSGSGGADCVSLCSAAQSGNCTAVKGDCNKFCSALTTVDPEANCDSQFNDYESCLGDPSTVCNTSCDSQEATLANCVTAYCATHATESSCVTLASSF